MSLVPAWNRSQLLQVIADHNELNGFACVVVVVVVVIVAVVVVVVVVVVGMCGMEKEKWKLYWLFYFHVCGKENLCKQKCKCVWVCLCKHVSVSMGVCTSKCVRECVFVNLWVWACVCMSKCECVRAWGCVCVRWEGQTRSWHLTIWKVFGYWNKTFPWKSSFPHSSHLRKEWNRIWDWKLRSFGFRKK